MLWDQMLSMKNWLHLRNILSFPANAAHRPNSLSHNIQMNSLAARGVGGFIQNCYICMYMYRYACTQMETHKWSSDRREIYAVNMKQQNRSSSDWSHPHKMLSVEISTRRATENIHLDLDKKCFMLTIDKEICFHNRDSLIISWCLWWTI